ncbi:hypothetical protein L1987_56008 [Smallanthus sonchifolius]|uniref:Uncharacterized protein n=1 Tax=Smallanthus sonchifolius TaxID=185202 RepID=A0ACB9ECM4_9ASTR|nr:hypothetical protein L1987_56008 [Smallanthus sonchifolius]
MSCHALVFRIRVLVINYFNMLCTKYDCGLLVVAFGFIYTIFILLLFICFLRFTIPLSNLFLLQPYF